MESIDDKEKIKEILIYYSVDIITCVFSALDLLLSRCNSFEDFKISVTQTINNLMKRDEENGIHNNR